MRYIEFEVCGRRQKMELDTETLNEVYQEVSDGCSEEPADVNATSRKAKNTKDDHWTVKEQSGTNRKDWKFWVFFNRKRLEVVSSKGRYLQQRATGRESGLDSASELLETRQRVREFSLLWYLFHSQSAHCDKQVHLQSNDVVFL